MTTQHTPGPWFVAKAKPRRVCGKDGVSICNAILRNQGGPKAKANLKDEHEAEANALLIAAAPDLYDALDNLTIGIGMGWDLDGLVAVARAAIAKATGA